MTSNIVNSKLEKFISSEVSFTEFENMLFSSSPRWPVKVGWITETGKRRFYKMYWINGPLAKTEQGAKMSETKAEMDMYNIRVIDEDGKWRTIDFNTVYKVEYRGKVYKVNN